MRRTLAALALLVSGLLSVPGLAGTASAAPAPDAPVALIGVPGLQWSDLGAEATPNLWRLAGQSALGSLSVRTVGRVTCPYDGWLTVSTGVRATVGYYCGEPPTPEPRGAGAAIASYGYLHDVAGEQHAGSLGSALRAAGRCSVAVGPGAALALADRTGAVDVYLPSAAQADAATLSRCPVVAADVDDLIRPYLAGGTIPRVPETLGAARRAAAVRAADAKVGALLAALPRNSTVLLAGVADHGSDPHLRVAMMRVPGGAGRLLGAASTHREDTTILPDVTATLLREAGVEAPANVVGTPWTPSRDRAGQVAETAASLARADTAGQTVKSLLFGFFTALAVLQVLFYAAVFLLLRRGRAPGGIRTAALVLASLPVSTLTVNLLPWDRAGDPALAHLGGVLGCALALGAIARYGPWHRHPLGPLTVVAVVTALVLAADLLTGSPLQLDSVVGYTTVQGGRYYGLGNIPFALFASSVLLSATVLAHWLIGRGRRGPAVVAVAALGGVAMILGGWPGVGSDFGGVIAFMPGIAVAALMIAGRRISPVKLGAFCVAGGVLVMTIAFLDSLRPPASQTHLGRFVGQVATGEALDVILRKLYAMLSTLLSPNLMPIVIAAGAFLVFTLMRPETVTAGALPAAFERSPALHAGFVGTLVSGVVGMLVNDSGAAVLSMALALAVPLVLTAGIGTRGVPTREPVSRPLSPATT
ncbi:hypothetical protein Misp01_15200 [Microtetraspora sp. NBRC 13810]|uniref:hypothetical protein n=1 Tax=Microtetraspora sp. NBRC 13810 TaxID=3030990 RepID=UPI0024A4976B|nr:hypothetical protein [Microtetraspora sp. NBRC 13810]GLW06390.1 hypothetical protein Misp01_15200 [Microtetraspora sp. NBRC 13810]